MYVEYGGGTLPKTCEGPGGIHSKVTCQLTINNDENG
jgi:hypothetical protein